MSDRAHDEQEASRDERLGPYLKRIRELAGLTQRQVEEASKELKDFDPVSNAYLSQLETEKVTDPSPRVLRTLSYIYRVPYRTLMTKAKYLRPEDEAPAGARLPTFADHGLSPEEEREALEYIKFRRQHKEPRNEER
jgi:HTH-type transcriptional regulator, competence development regulator